ncbi:AfsR/SARP family transcriptional regulator [Cellulomonas soli]
MTGRGANLIAALVLAPGRTLSTVQALDLTWPDGAPSSGRAALQTLVSRLRATTSPGLLASTSTGYRLDVDPVGVDLDRAEGLGRRAGEALSTGDPRAADAHAVDGLSLWVGAPGSDVPDPELAGELRVRAASAERELLRVRAEALLQLDDPAAVGAAAASVEAAPLDDSALLTRLRALHAAGRTTEAVAEYAAYRERLRDTLGTDPSGELAAFHGHLLQGGTPSARVGTDASPATSRGRGQAAGPPPGDTRRPGRSTPGVRAYPSALLGRQRDLDGVEAALRTARVVTVLGAGGVGKTRLGHEVARRAAARHEALAVVELVGARTAADVLPVVAASLGVPETSPRLGLTDARARPWPTGCSTGSPSGRPCSCSTTASRCSTAWPPGCPRRCPPCPPSGCSPRAGRRWASWGARAPAGTLAARLPDGSAGPAVDLFVERATAVRPTVTLPLETVAGLCERLDGLPLAIELAAARTRSMTVAEIERRLTDRFALLVGGASTAPARHRTLRAVIDWSWDLLTGRQQALCRRVSGFADGFPAAAAGYAARAAQPAAARADLVADADPPAAVLDDLDALVAQSLLRVEEDAAGGMRYRMLETVREFAERAAVDAGEGPMARAVVMDWARDLCRTRYSRVDSIEHLLLDRVVADEQETLVLALRLALADGRPDTAAAVFSVVGMLWGMQGAYGELVALAPASLAVWESAWGVVGYAGRGPVTVPASEAEPLLLGLSMIATIELTFGDLRTGATAWRSLRRVLATDPPLRPVTSALAGMVAHLRDLRAVEELLAASRASHDLPTSRFGHMASWVLAENVGDIDGAITYARAGYDLAAGSGDAWWQVLCASSVASAYGESRQARQAWEWTEVTARHLSELGAAGATPVMGEMHAGVEQVRALALLTLGDLGAAEPYLHDLVEGRGGRTTV